MLMKYLKKLDVEALVGIRYLIFGRTITMLITAGLLSTGAMAAATLEFAAGTGNPTGNGPTLGPVAIQLQLNSDDPTGNTLAVPSVPVTASFSLSNQQFPNATTNLNGIMFGARITLGVPLPQVSPLFPTMDSISAASSSNFSSTASTVGQGIDLTVNNGVEVLTSTYPISQLASPPSTLGTDPGGRFYLGDLTVSFSTPVQNPVIHLVGLGANYSGLGFTTDLELTTAGVTPTLLSGDGLAVAGNNINNSHSILSGRTGDGAASGSVLLTGTNISQLSFKLYMRGDGETSNWPVIGGDQILVGFSMLPPPAPQAIPTLSEWALILLCTLLMAGAFVARRGYRAGSE